MLLQTNSYIVPKDRRVEHDRLVRRFRQVLNRLGCDQYEVYEQVGSNWSGGEKSGRFVQLMRFRDRKHQLTVQSAERNDPVAQALIKEFCELINFPYQQQQGLFAIGYYQRILPDGADLEPSGAQPAPEIVASVEQERPSDDAPPEHQGAIEEKPSVPAEQAEEIEIQQGADSDHDKPQ